MMSTRSNNRVALTLAFLILTLSSVIASNNIANELEQKVVSLFSQMDKHPVAISRDNNNIQVRTSQQGDQMITFSEAKHTDIHPDKFKGFLENFQSEFPKVNTMVESVKPLTTINKKIGNRVGVKSILKFPFPLTDRIMIHWKYLNLHRGGPKQHEHMLYLSEQSNDELINSESHYSEAEKKKYVLGKTFLCAYWIRPIYCEQEEDIIGSKISYLFSGDTGGNVPMKIQNMMGPKAALESIQNLIEHVKSKSK